MAATGTPTPNIGLRIPQGTDPASVDDINYNSNLLDTKLGAVGNTSVQDQIDSLNGKTPKIEYRTLTYYISENLVANETLNITISLSPALPFTPVGAIVQTKERNIMYVVTYFDLSASSITIRVSAGKNVTDLTTPRYVSILFIG